MSLWIDRKYLLLNSNRLRNFKQKSQDLFNFSCCFCGDSAKNTLKARGYVYEKKNKYFFRCHNCGAGTTFSAFLKHIDPNSHREYIMEKFTNRTKKETKKVEQTTTVVKFPIHRINKELPSIDDLEDEHYAKKYIIGRKIPQERWKEIFYAIDFKKFMDEKYPNHGKQKLESNDSRLCLFFTDLKGNITHIGSRSLSPEPKIRYLTVKVAEVERKIFGLQHVDFSKTIYILEGQFDSMFVENAVASGDSSLEMLADSLQNSNKNHIDTVLVYDNEKRNKQLVNQIEHAIENGHKVVIWPNDMSGKDINDMVKDYGYTKNEIMEIIRKNTYESLSAGLRFSQWRKC